MLTTELVCSQFFSCWGTLFGLLVSEPRSSSGGHLDGHRTRSTAVASQHTATLLLNGKVLVVEGLSDSCCSSQRSGLITRWQAAGMATNPLNGGRFQHTATLSSEWQSVGRRRCSPAPQHSGQRRGLITRIQEPGHRHHRCARVLASAALPTHRHAASEWQSVGRRRCQHRQHSGQRRRSMTRRQAHGCPTTGSLSGSRYGPHRHAASEWQSVGRRRICPQHRQHSGQRARL